VRLVLAGAVAGLVTGTVLAGAVNGDVGGDVTTVCGIDRVVITGFVTTVVSAAPARLPDPAPHSAPARKVAARAAARRVIVITTRLAIPCILAHPVGGRATTSPGKIRFGSASQARLAWITSSQ
jgi:hypothetical protein